MSGLGGREGSWELKELAAGGSLSGVCEQFFFEIYAPIKKILSIWLQQKADAARPERASASGTLNFSQTMHFRTHMS